MEILAVILSGLSLVLSAVILIVVLRRKDASVTKDDLSKIKEDTATEISKMSELIKSGIEGENRRFLEIVGERLDGYAKSTQGLLNLISDTIEKSLTRVKNDSNERLDAIQKLVEDKLQKTIDEKLKSSFESVILQIGNVNKAIGEIKSIATDVGSLKNVLANVKTRGITGEIILGNILSEILSPEQYLTNIATVKGSKDVVEFAIKIPSGDDFMLLPLDSKFPLTAYTRLKDAIDTGDKKIIDTARSELRSAIRTQAKLISKYINVPQTTDFAIMFLPTESLYIEAIEMGLFEECQREFHINISGPTTLAALISALKLGFSSVEIQKRSGEVFKLLGVVRTEFEKFAKALASTQTRFRQVESELDELVGKRTRIMQQKLDGIATAYPQEEAL